MNPFDPEAMKREIEKLLPLRETQITPFTDSLLVRDTTTGACGLASCVYIEWNGQPYAISCHHVLKDSHEYIAGAKRLSKNIIEEGDSHAVAPLRLIASDAHLDLALFDLNGLTLSTIPRQAYSLAQNQIDFERTNRNLGAVTFIHGVPGFASRGLQYDDGLVFLQSPIYSAHGPIVEVTENLVVADFAETELIEFNAKDFPQLRDFKPSGGARDLGGMSGSGLWVLCGEQFSLLGILLGRSPQNDAATEHRIQFTPIWKTVEWLNGIPQINRIN